MHALISIPPDFSLSFCFRQKPPASVSLLFSSPLVVSWTEALQSIADPLTTAACLECPQRGSASGGRTGVSLPTDGCAGAPSLTRAVANGDGFGKAYARQPHPAREHGSPIRCWLPAAAATTKSNRCGGYDDVEPRRRRRPTTAAAFVPAMVAPRAARPGLQPFPTNQRTYYSPFRAERTYSPMA